MVLALVLGGRAARGPAASSSSRRLRRRRCHSSSSSSTSSGGAYSRTKSESGPHPSSLLVSMSLTPIACSPNNTRPTDVYPSGEKHWAARLSLGDGYDYFIGLYDTPEKAAKEVDKDAKKRWLNPERVTDVCMHGQADRHGFRPIEGSRIRRLEGLTWAVLAITHPRVFNFLSNGSLNPDRFERRNLVPRPRPVKAKKQQQEQEAVASSSGSEGGGWGKEKKKQNQTLLVSRPKDPSLRSSRFQDAHWSGDWDGCLDRRRRAIEYC